MKLACWTAAAAITAAPMAADAEPLSLYAAGSLRTALGDVAASFSDAYGVEILPSFGPSGLMRERIEAGETAHVFASANMGHPRTLEEAGRGGPVALFARNRLCALVQPELEVTRWGTIKAEFTTGRTALENVYAVGDIVRGASLVVWAIRDGRDCANAILTAFGAPLAVAAE